jgi:hypothetical protein
MTTLQAEGRMSHPLQKPRTLGQAGCPVLARALDRSPAPELLPLPLAFSLPPSLWMTTFNTINGRLQAQLALHAPASNPFICTPRRQPISPATRRVCLQSEAFFAGHATSNLRVTAVCLGLIVARPELSARDAAQEELPCLRLSAGNVFEKERPASRRSCRSTIRRGPKLFPSERVRSRRARDRFWYKQIATAANFPVLSVAGFHRDYNRYCGRSALHGHHYARSCKN